jgi:TonB family protein
MTNPDPPWPTGPSVLHGAQLLLLLCIGIARPASAQFLEKAEFEGGVERVATDGPRTAWANPTFCRFVIDLSVDRSGRLLSAAVNVPLSSCKDPALVSKANALAQRYVFTPNPQAPEPQAVRLVWAVGERPQHEDPFGNDPVQMVPPPSMPEAPETSVVQQPRSEISDEPEQVVVQEDYQSPNDPYTIVDEMPEFPGGPDALYPYIRETLKYPGTAIEQGVEGIVYLTFVVETDGTLSDIKVLRGIGAGCDEEALRIVRGMPKWKPGKQRGVPVRVRYNLPIRFKLQEPEVPKE